MASIRITKPSHLAPARMAYSPGFIIRALSLEEVLSVIGLVVNSLQALVLPITIYLLVVQRNAPGRDGSPAFFRRWHVEGGHG